jgi:hypothetical protein
MVGCFYVRVGGYIRFFFGGEMVGDGRGGIVGRIKEDDRGSLGGVGDVSL